MDKVEKFLREKKYHSIDSLRNMGLSYYKILKMAEEGKLIRINKKYYESSFYDGEQNDLFGVTAYDEKGVVCLLSAAVYHGLSDERPQKIEVAIPRGSRIPSSPEYPKMHFLLFSPSRYELGKTKVEDENDNSFYVYDKEKTVCDLMFYRNRIGFDAALSAIRNYLSTDDKNIGKLLSYADSLSMGKIMRKALEVMVYE